MIDGRSVLAVIPARGGSKGVPRKNVRELGGKPLIAWTIEAAKASQLIDRVVLTSEDAEIIEIAQRYGCEAPFVRPVELARDDTPGMAPIKHALSELPGYNYIVALQPTSPLRSVQDIDQCIAKYHASGADNCVSVIEADTPQAWLFTMDAHEFLTPLGNAKPDVRRQESSVVWALNGAVYVSSTDWITNHGSFLKGRIACHKMPPERSLDVDTPWDWHLLQCVVEAPAFVR